MIKLLKIGLFIILISTNTIYSQNKNYHIVIKGETIYSISKKYNLSIEEITSINKLESNILSIGQKIYLEENIEKKEVETNTIKEEGFASTISVEDSSEKYLALHKTASIGTIIFVKNQMNDNMVIVRVIGKLPETGVNDKISLRISKIAFEKLDAKDEKIPVELTYVNDSNER